MGSSSIKIFVWQPRRFGRVRVATVALVGTVASCLALVAFADNAAWSPEDVRARAAAQGRADRADRAAKEHESGPSTSATAPPGGPVLDQTAAELTAQKAAAEAAEQKAAEQKAAEQKAAEQRAAEQRAAEQKAAELKAAAQKAAAQRAAAASPRPVAGLTQAQMNNAARIVATGQKLGLPKRAFVLAIACAMQESTLRNLASSALPESFDYPNEGTGSDHDSVGLFQQRPSAGWGTVKDLMNPAYAATKFYQALLRVPGWQDMALTYAIQAVQVSGYPDAYAKHERLAQTIVSALT